MWDPPHHTHALAHTPCSSHVEESGSCLHCSTRRIRVSCRNADLSGWACSPDQGLSSEPTPAPFGHESRMLGQSAIFARSNAQLPDFVTETSGWAQIRVPRAIWGGGRCPHISIRQFGVPHHPLHSCPKVSTFEFRPKPISTQISPRIQWDTCHIDPSRSQPR